MAGMMYETYMLQALANGIQSIQKNVSQLSDILDALNTSELAAAQSFFGNAQNKIYIAPGFPADATRMPFVGVTVASEEQIPDQTPIGLAYERINNGDGTWSDIKGARFKGVVKATIYTPNADIMMWLSAVCSWAILSQYDFFSNTAGMNNLQSGLSDYEPQPVWLPSFVFTRGIWLSAEYDKTYVATPHVITSATSTATFIDIVKLKS